MFSLCTPSVVPEWSASLCGGGRLWQPQRPLMMPGTRRLSRGRDGRRRRRVVNDKQMPCGRSSLKSQFGDETLPEEVLVLFFHLIWFLSLSYSSSLPSSLPLLSSASSLSRVFPPKQRVGPSQVLCAALAHHKFRAPLRSAAAQE